MTDTDLSIPQHAKLDKLGNLNKGDEEPVVVGWHHGGGGPIIRKHGNYRWIAPDGRLKKVARAELETSGVSWPE